MPYNLIPQDQGTPEDSRGRRKPIRPEDLRSGTLYGQYQLRGSILTIKDASATASGFMSFSDSMTNAPTSSSSGTGVYIDYTGIYGLAAGVKQFYWTSADGKGYAGAGAVLLDVNGIVIDADGGNYLIFTSGTDTGVGIISASASGGQDLLQITANNNGTATEGVNRLGANSSNNTAAFDVRAHNTNGAWANLSSPDTFLGLYVGANGSQVPVSILHVEGDIAIIDGMTAPGTTSGVAKIYVDTADGDLKVKFGDGTVKTLATDT